MGSKFLVTAGAAVAAMASAPAHSADYVVNGTVSALRVSYIEFFFGGGAIDIFTTGIIGPSGQELDDPMIRLLVNDGSPYGALTGANVATDDDTFGLDPLISGTFAAGNYILAIGEFELTEGEARSGIASTPPFDGDFRTTFTTDAAFQFGAAVPEPGTWAMLVVGFGALGGAMRSRRSRKLALSYA